MGLLAADRTDSHNGRSSGAAKSALPPWPLSPKDTSHNRAQLEIFGHQVGLPAEAAPQKSTLT